MSLLTVQGRITAPTSAWRRPAVPPAGAPSTIESGSGQSATARSTGQVYHRDRHHADTVAPVIVRTVAARTARWNHAATVAAVTSDHGPFSPRVLTQRSMETAVFPPAVQPQRGGPAQRPRAPSERPRPPIARSARSNSRTSAPCWRAWAATRPGPRRSSASTASHCGRNSSRRVLPEAPGIESEAATFPTPTAGSTGIRPSAHPPRSVIRAGLHGSCHARRPAPSRRPSRWAASRSASTRQSSR